MADITTHLERLSKTAMDLEIPVLLEAKEEILRLRQSWHLHKNEIEQLRADNDYLQKIIAEYQSAYGFFAPRAALGEKE